jgi:hypothetical protein
MQFDSGIWSPTVTEIELMSSEAFVQKLALLFLGVCLKGPYI